MYTIGQVSQMFHLPVSTLRYYDKEGLFPTMERQSGIRKFGERELEALTRLLSQLPPRRHNVLRQTFINAGPGAPVCFVVQRQGS